MVAAEFGHGPDSAIHGLTRRTTSVARIGGDRSQVAMRGGTAIGAILWRTVKGVGVVDARVVQPGFRGGWPNVLLLEAGLRRARTEGVQRFRFPCDDTVRGTLKLVKRCAAVETEIKSSWYYAIAADGRRAERRRSEPRRRSEVPKPPALEPRLALQRRRFGWCKPLDEVQTEHRYKLAEQRSRV